MARYTITHKGSTEPVNYPGVTTITGLIDKSTVLMAWAVKMMMLWLHKNWTEYVTDEVKEALKNKNKVWIEFEEQEDYFKMLEDAKDHYKEVSDEAKEIGIMVHDQANEYIKSKLLKRKFSLNDDLPEKVKNRFNELIKWFDLHVIRFIETEQPICSKKHGFCGTLDIIAELKPAEGITGGIYVIDIKSSKGFYDGQVKQVAGYKIGREEGGAFHLLFKDDNDKENIIINEYDIDLKPVKIDGIGILTTNYKDTGKVEFKDYTGLIDIKEKAFLKLLDFYYSDKNRRLKNNPFILKNQK